MSAQREANDLLLALQAIDEVPGAAEARADQFRVALAELLEES